MAPAVEVDSDQVVAKDVILVVDTSGSMEGQKMSQAKEAAAFVVDNLNPRDRFNIIAFSTGIRNFENELVPAGDAGDYRQFIERLEAVGGTNISGALLEAVAQADDERPTTLIFLTDGLATEGITDTSLLLDTVEQQAADNVRLFAFGVGDDVDTALLDSLTQNHRGTTTYVRPGQDIEEAVSAFYAKVSTPVLANISLDFDDIVVEQMYPQELPDLFAGGQLVLVGRYRDGGPATITLTCEYCGFAKPIATEPGVEIAEQDLLAALERQVAQRSETEDASAAAARHEVECSSCGARVVFTGQLVAKTCVHCGSAIARESVRPAAQRIPIDGVLALAVSAEQARQAVQGWLRSLWFAPNEFVRQNVPERLRGVYLPYWTFDAITANHYRGERGTAHIRTVRVNGKRVQRREIRWHPVSGSFQRFFDDRVVAADRSLPRPVLRRLEPWPLHRCVPYTPDVLAGYVAKTWDLPLDEGFKIARERMEAELRDEARRQIGGDAQRVHSVSTRWDALSYKHLLLPLWLLAMRHRGSAYRLYVNAATAEVQGERPWSQVKIGLALSAAATVVGVLLARWHGLI